MGINRIFNLYYIIYYGILILTPACFVAGFGLAEQFKISKI